MSLGVVKFTGHRGVPDEDQGSNECAPTSAANSFEWLDNTYGLELASDRDEANEIRDILKDASHMMTNGGTTDEKMIKGKLQFISENMLPLTVEFQDNSLGDIMHAGLTAENKGNQSTFDFIFDQLVKGQDVELRWTWNAGSGHWVTVTGAGEILGNKVIFYNDPADGVEQTKVSFVGTSEAGEPFPGFLEVENEADNSAGIVAESPKKVGGIALPVDFTSLFVAGFSSNAGWVLSTIMALTGSGILIARARTKKHN